MELECFGPSGDGEDPTSPLKITKSYSYQAQGHGRGGRPSGSWISLPRASDRQNLLVMEALSLRLKTTQLVGNAPRRIFAITIDAKLTVDLPALLG